MLQIKVGGRSGSYEKLPKASPQNQLHFTARFMLNKSQTYYCFTCQQNICPECAIHGSHKDQEVKLIKKAINEAKSEFLDVISKIGSSQNNMNKYRDFFGKSIKESNQRNIREKSLVSQQFELLRNLLTNQEKQILRNLDNVNKQNITMISGFIEQINKIYEQIEKNKKQIQGILRRDQVLIFEEYKHVPSLQSKAEDLRKKSDDILGEYEFLNSEFLQQQTKQLTSLIKKIQLKTKKQRWESGHGNCDQTSGQHMIIINLNLQNINIS